MGREFRYCGEKWFAEIPGFSSGGGAVPLEGPTDPSMTWQLTFRCLSNSSKGPYTGRSITADINQITEEELKKTLKEAMEGSGPCTEGV